MFTIESDPALRLFRVAELSADHSPANRRPADWIHDTGVFHDRLTLFKQGQPGLNTIERKVRRSGASAGGPSRARAPQ